MSTWVDGLTNPFLLKHLSFVENTESPRIMHVWSAITAISACMGRHLWLDTGIGPLYPNIYVLLVGPPGARKTSAINFAMKAMKETTHVRFAPDDTSGQRKGLIKALVAGDINGFEAEQQVFSDMLPAQATAFLGGMQLTNSEPDKYCLFICATEFGSFLGHNSLDLTRFLIKLWDCEPYRYQISEEHHTIPNTCAVMIGGTTATDIATILPPEAMGQGFMSRIILVFAAEKEKTVPRASFREELFPDLQATYKRVNLEMKGAMQETEAAFSRLNFIYRLPIKMNDHRFMYYAERRHTHLMKVATCLAAARNSMFLDVEDVNEAHLILTETEKTMTDALGEYGLSPTAAAKQKMLEYLVHQARPILDATLWAIMQRDMKLIDYRNAIAQLKNAGRLLDVNTKDGIAYAVKGYEFAQLQSMEDNELDALFGDLNRRH